ncbi:fatty acid desaturase [Pleurocapsa sp. PCC 7319]|uniref:fatty acid desaturase family protein n=1 Tax=Pleurocapsa sp. PCC 7319 TaxID=118161 RepID=UPI0003498CA3|nr:fatty acid desaturase [Pleurocapsa sp. PCC 7319]
MISTKPFAKRPKLPSSFYEPTFIGSFTFVIYSLLMFVLPGLTCRYVYYCNLPLPIKVFFQIPLVLISCQGLQLLTLVGHEGFHLSLHKNRYVSILSGIFLSSIIFSFFEIGSAFPHWDHHRHTNQPNDPDVKIFSKFNSFWSRIFVAKITANRSFIRNTFLAALNKDLDYPYKFPIRNHEIVLFAWFNILSSLFWTSIYVLLFIHDPVLCTFLVITPHLFLPITGLRAYIEHAGLSAGPFLDSRSRISFMATLLYYYNNYHLEHHLYPSVPCYKLPLVYKYLKSNGFYDKLDVPIEENFWSAIKYIFPPYKYAVDSKSKQIKVDYESSKKVKQV